MKNRLLILLFCLGSLLQLSAQDVMWVKMKDGTTVIAPVNSLQGMKYTQDAAGPSPVLTENITVSCIPSLNDEMIYEGTIPSFLTHQASDQLTSAFQGYQTVTMTNVETGEMAYITSFLNKAGDLNRFYGIGNDFSYTLRQLTGLEPKVYTLQLDVTPLYMIGGIFFTKKATCTFTYKPNTLPVEDAYYLVGTHNNWKLTDRLTHAGDNKYDGHPFKFTIAAPRQSGALSEEHLRIVPASAVSGDSYDEALALGLTGELQVNDYDSQKSYYCSLESGGADIVLPADDNCTLYTVYYYPSWNSLAVEGENTSTVFGRCYSNLGFSNPQKMADGYTDINGMSSNEVSMVRQLVNLNDLATDEMLCTWGDAGVSDLNFNTWNANTPQLSSIYARLQKGVEYCNKYLLSGEGSQQEVAEVRFLRAYYNAQLLDLFGNVPVCKGFNDIQPVVMSRQVLFDYLIGELTDCVADMAAPHHRTSGDADYERVDQAAAWMLLARLFLNAEVYTGTANWVKAAEYAQKVVDSGAYQLYTTAQNGWSAYQQLFMGDNGENGASCESLMTIAYDGENATDWGQVFLMAANYSNDVKATDGGELGLNQKWLGFFARPELPAKFFPNGNVPYVNTADMVRSAGDDRALFWGENRGYDVKGIDYNQGFTICKYINRYATGGVPKSEQKPDFDIFLMRYAETLLTLAEANLRMGNESVAVGYLNQVRQRANANALSTCTLQDVLDEWTREFYQEGRHRTDLVRFGQYGGSSAYQWHWKGGIYAGHDFDATRNVFPLPASVLETNPNAIQNPGY